MELFSRARRALNVDDDALAALRDRIRLNFSRLAALALTPFALLHLVGANWPMFTVNLVLVGLMLANHAALRRGRAPVVPFAMIALAMVAGACTSVIKQGIYGVLWAYPALFMFFFVLSRRMAMMLGCFLLAAMTAASAFALGPAMAARVLMSLAIVLVMINVVLNVVADLQRALVAQACTDPLTGAFNRRHLQDHLAQHLAPPGPAAVGDVLLAIDIDHFKRVNDTHGHAAGDEVLRRLVKTIEARKRTSDLLFRIGGEEFVLLLPRISLPAAQAVAEDLRLLVAQADLLSGETITVSIGVAAHRAGQASAQWLKAADHALYEAKRGGRNRVVVAA